MSRVTTLLSLSAMVGRSLLALADVQVWDPPRECSRTAQPGASQRAKSSHKQNARKQTKRRGCQ